MTILLWLLILTTGDREEIIIGRYTQQARCEEARQAMAGRKAPDAKIDCVFQKVR